MNYESGFTQFSTYYTNRTTGAFLEFFSEVAGGGSIVGTISLPPNLPGTPPCTGDPSGFFCNFSEVSVALSGTAKSVLFSGTANQIGYDNTKFNPQLDPGQAVPGPLPLFGVAAAFGMSRNLKRRIRSAMPSASTSL